MHDDPLLQTPNNHITMTTTNDTTKLIQQLLVFLYSLFVKITRSHPKAPCRPPPPGSGQRGTTTRHPDTPPKYKQPWE